MLQVYLNQMLNMLSVINRRLRFYNWQILDGNNNMVNRGVKVLILGRPFSNYK